MTSRLSFPSDNEKGALGARRALLAIGIRFSLAVVLLDCRTGFAAAAGCTDPDDLSGADMALRKSVDYTELSSDEKTTCRGCAFFKLGTGECGTCQIVSGLVSAHGHCTSWSARVEGR
jgi:High potential iron-sulfur protein